jgi:simple sugar transport system substrate-binding protein
MKRRKNMKNKKVLFMVAIVLVTLFASTGCQPAAPTAAPATEAPTAAPVKELKGLTVGFIQTGTEGAWRAANTADFKETATARGINLKFYDAQNKLENQISAFSGFIADKVDVIILSPLETKGFDAVLGEAKNAKIPVVLQDRRLDTTEDMYAFLIGSDMVEEGRKAGKEMCKLLEGSANKNVVEIQGNVGSSPQIDRGKGFREAIADCGITITQSQTGNWSTTEAKAVMEAWLKQSTDIQGVFAQNDEEGLGAIQAIEEAGLKPGVDIKIISVDATKGAFQAMIDGKQNVVVECNPLLANQIFDMLDKYLKGEQVPKYTPSQEGVFYPDNAAEVLPTRKY